MNINKIEKNIKYNKIVSILNNCKSFTNLKFDYSDSHLFHSYKNSIGILYTYLGKHTENSIYFFLTTIKKPYEFRAIAEIYNYKFLENNNIQIFGPIYNVYFSDNLKEKNEFELDPQFDYILTYIS